MKQRVKRQILSRGANQPAPNMKAAFGWLDILVFFFFYNETMLFIPGIVQA